MENSVFRFFHARKDFDTEQFYCRKEVETMWLPLTIPARKYRLYMLLIFGVLLYFFANFQRVGIPGTVFDLLQNDLTLTAPYVTAFGAVFMYVYAVGQLIVGLFADRYGGVRTMLGGGVLFCAGSLLFPLCYGSLPLMYLCRALTGLGASSIYLSMVKEVLQTFPRNYPIMLSFMQMVGYSGGIAAGVPFAGLVHCFSLQSVLIGAGSIIIVLYCGFVFMSGTLRLNPIQNTPLHLGNYLKVLHLRHNRYVFCFSGINFGLYYVLQTVIGKKFLEDFAGMDPIKAAWILSIMTGISSFAGLLVACWSKMLGNKRKVPCVTAGIGVMVVFGMIFLLVLLNIRTPLLGVLLFLLSLTSSCLSPITVPLLKETNERTLTGEAVAFSNFSAYISVAVFGNLVGVLLNIFPAVKSGNTLAFTRGSYLLLFGVLFCFALLAAFCSLKLTETSGKQTSVQ